MAITVTEPNKTTTGANNSFYVALHNPILFNFDNGGSPAAQKIEIAVKRSSDNSTIISGLIYLFDASSNGEFIFDVSPYLYAELSNSLNFDYSAPIEDNNLMLGFYLEYKEYPDVSPTTAQNTNTFYAVNNARQLHSPLGQNNGDLAIWANEDGQVLTSFDKVKKWRNYPISISVISDTTIGIKYADSTAGINSQGAYVIPLEDSANDYTLELIDISLFFETSWNLIDGNFVQGVTSPQTATWTLPDLNVLTGNLINTNLGGFDGTKKTVFIKNIASLSVLFIQNKKTNNTLDLSAIDLVNLNTELVENATDFAAGYGFDNLVFKDNATILRCVFQRLRITTIDVPQLVASTAVTINYNDFLQEINFKAGSTVGATLLLNFNDLLALDLSNLTFSNTDLGVGDNNNLATLTGGSGSLTNFNANNTALTTLDLTGKTVSGQLNCLNSVLTSAILDTTSHVPTSLNLSGNSLTTLTLNGCNLDSTTTSFSLANNGASTANVDNWLVQIDNNAAAGGTGLILIGGTNAAPTGGAGNANVVSLVGKGYTVVHS